MSCSSAGGMGEFTGWLLDLYEDPGAGLKLWFITEDERRVCVFQRFPVTFYAAGPRIRLRALWRWLAALPAPPRLARDVRRDLFLPDPLPVLAVEVEKPSDQRGLFQKVEKAFPDLTYYDADIQVQLRHAARCGTFPLARCRLQVGADGFLHEIEPLDSRWDLDPAPVPLRVMEIDLDGDPRRGQPGCMQIRFHSFRYSLPLREGGGPAFWLKRALLKHEPDILVTDSGDTWLFDYLLESVHNCWESLPLSRDPDHPLVRIREKTYFSYGQVVHRGQQVHLFGRVHVDRCNAMLWSDYSLDGILENARVTGLPIQTAARVSPGTGISSMQMITALQTGVLVPWHKQQAERPKTALDLIHSDSGGLIYQPTVGLHSDVGEIDFVSMYPAIMVRCDISPEKTPVALSDPPPASPGLVPQTLAPLLQKRVALKNRIPTLPAWDPRRRIYRAQSSAQKWLLVVCFGYLGYRNARFGRIEAHEAVTSGGREALLRAKEAAEDAGFEILHMYVDGLWVRQEGCVTPESYAPLIEEVNRRTGLHIALDGIFRWVVFLPSRVDERVPVGNRYFGVFQDGTVKIRGLEARRHDTPPWVAAAQTALIEHLALAPDAGCLPGYVPGAVELLRAQLARLKAGEVPCEELLISQRLSRDLVKYTAPSPAARAARQLEAAGRPVGAGQRVRFVFTRGAPGVRAWDLPTPPDPAALDTALYARLLLRAAENVLQPFGVTAAALKLQIEQGVRAVPLFPPRPRVAALPSLQARPVENMLVTV